MTETMMNQGGEASLQDVRAFVARTRHHQILRQRRRSGGGVQHDGVDAELSERGVNSLLYFCR